MIFQCEVDLKVLHQGATTICSMGSSCHFLMIAPLLSPQVQLWSKKNPFGGLLGIVICLHRGLGGHLFLRTLRSW